MVPAWIREHLAHAADIKHPALQREVNGHSSTALIVSRTTDPKEET
jgi:hypothetical protein